MYAKFWDIFFFLPLSLELFVALLFFFNLEQEHRPPVILGDELPNSFRTVSSDAPLAGNLVVKPVIFLWVSWSDTIWLFFGTTKVDTFRHMQRRNMIPTTVHHKFQSRWVFSPRVPCFFLGVPSLVMWNHYYLILNLHMWTKILHPFAEVACWRLSFFCCSSLVCELYP